MGSERTLLFRTLVSRCPIHRVSSDMVAGPQPIFARWDGECPSRRGPHFPGRLGSKGDLAVASLIFPSNRVSPFLLFCEAFVTAQVLRIYLLPYVAARNRFSHVRSSQSLSSTKIIANAKPLPGIHFLNASFRSYFYTWLDFRITVPNLHRDSGNSPFLSRSCTLYIYIRVCVYIYKFVSEGNKAYGVSLGHISTTLSF